MTELHFPAPLQLRSAQSGDAASLARFAGDMFAETFGHSVTPDVMERFVAATYTRERLENEIADALMSTRLLMNEDAIVGFYQLRWPSAADERRASGVEVARFYVARGWHGTGVARELMRAALVEARSSGVTRVWLGVWQENARAIAFYLKSGFKTVAAQQFLLGEVEQSDFVMAQEFVAS